MKNVRALFIIGIFLLSVVLSGCISITFDQTFADDGSSDYKVSYDISSVIEMAKSYPGYENQTQKDPCENIKKEKPSYTCTWDKKGIVNLTTHFTSPEESNGSYTFTTEEGLFEKTYRITVNKLQMPSTSPSSTNTCSVYKSDEGYFDSKYTCKAEVKGDTINLDITSNDTAPFTVTAIKCGATVQQTNKTIVQGATEKFVVDCPSKSSYSTLVKLMSDNWTCKIREGFGYSCDITKTTNNSYTIRIKNNKNEPINITHALCTDEYIRENDGMDIAQNPNMSLLPGQEATLNVNCVKRDGTPINIYEKSYLKIYLSSNGEEWNMEVDPQSSYLNVRVRTGSGFGSTGLDSTSIKDNIELGTNKGKVSASSLKMMGIDMTYTVHMPGKIVNATPAKGITSMKDNMVTYDLLEVLDSGEKITVESKEKVCPIGWVILLVGIVSVGGMFIKKTK